MNRAAGLFATSIAALAAACTGTDIGNPVIDIDVSAYEEPEPTARRAIAVAVDGATVTEAWVAVDRVRLRDAATCDGDTQLELAGPYAIDMLAPGAIEPLSGIEVAAGGYCRFELRWAEADQLPGSAPAELPGAAIYLAGTRRDGTPFVLRSERNDELRLDAVGGAFSIDDATHALFVGFDLAALLAGVDLDAGVVSDGTVRIEPGQNDDLLDAFDDNVADAASLFDDDDDDGDLGVDERDDGDILAE